MKNLADGPRGFDSIGAGPTHLGTAVDQTNVVPSDVASLCARSDQSLIAQFRSGDNDAATALYLRYARRLNDLATRSCSRRLASRVSPEDIVQSVFRTFFRRAARGAYAAPRGDDLWKLLLVMALNKVRAAGAFHRAARRDVTATLGGDALAHVDARGASRDAAALDTLSMVIDEVLAKLPASHRIIVEMRVRGHEIQEIADHAGRAKRSVERVLQEFRKMLAAQIQEQD